MKIAILASEGAPYMKSGGLGDVMEALPAALSRIEGNEVALILPYYKKILESPAYEVELAAQFYVALGWRQQYAGIYRLKNRNDSVQVYFIDNLYYFGGRCGSAYGDGDDGERFAYFSKACLDALIALDFIPDVIQCNDWQTAPVPVFLKAQYYPFFPNMDSLERICDAGLPDNVWIDTAHYLLYAYRTVMAKMVRLAGARHVVFGTDSPLQGPMQMRFAQEVIRALDIPEGEKDAIFHGNAEKILRLK